MIGSEEGRRFGSLSAPEIFFPLLRQFAGRDTTGPFPRVHSLMQAIILPCLKYFSGHRERHQLRGRFAGQGAHQVFQPTLSPMRVNLTPTMPISQEATEALLALTARQLQLEPIATRLASCGKSLRNVNSAIAVSRPRAWGGGRRAVAAPAPRTAARPMRSPVA